MEHKDIKTEHITKYWDYHLEYLQQILSGEYDLEEARKDLISFIIDNHG